MIVVRKTKTDESTMYITSRDDFEKTNLCDCRDNYGNTVGCQNAGCYSVENSYCDAAEECVKALYKHLNVSSDDIDSDDLDDALNGCNELLEGIEQEKIDSFIEKWREENENHVEVTAWNYWDNSNWRTFILEAESGEVDVEEVENSEEILKEYPGVPLIEGTETTVETENFAFTFNIWANDPWPCTVEML